MRNQCNHHIIRVWEFRSLVLPAPIAASSFPSHNHERGHRKIRLNLEPFLQRPRSPIEKSPFGAASHPGGEESSPRSDLGIAVSGGAGRCYQGSPRLRPGILGRAGGGQTSSKVKTPRNPAVRGQVAARMRVRLATVAVR